MSERRFGKKEAIIAGALVAGAAGVMTERNTNDAVGVESSDSADSASLDTNSREVIDTSPEAQADRLQDLLTEKFPSLTVQREGSTFHVIDSSLGENGLSILDISHNEDGGHSAWLSDDLQEWLEGEANVFKYNKNAHLDGYELRVKGADVETAIADAQALAKFKEKSAAPTASLGDMFDSTLGSSLDIQKTVFYQEDDPPEADTGR